MLNLIKKLYNDSRIRYLFFGGLTTLVNLGMFALLKGPCGIDYKISNFFSVAIAICFAFVVNKLYVFFWTCSCRIHNSDLVVAVGWKHFDV